MLKDGIFRGLTDAFNGEAPGTATPNGSLFGLVRLGRYEQVSLEANSL